MDKDNNRVINGKLNNVKIGVIGLGYVGLPLALNFSNKGFGVVGFDIDVNKVSKIKKKDFGNLVDSKEILNCSTFFPTSSPEELKDVNFFIVTVPTPVDSYFIPDLSFLKSACILIGKLLKPKDIVVFESTVFPGCTEEICIPLLEQYSGLKNEVEFGVGYSPERINPGDTVHTLKNVKKIISSNSLWSLKIIEEIYDQIVEAGLYISKSIKIAEAAKVIENAQRDLNISFVNELALIFDRMGIDTNDVIDAAASKWNFMSFRPGLVGGHCISVDPYYLTYKSEELGYVPEVIHSGRRVNNFIPHFIFNKIIQLLLIRKVETLGARILIMGFAFKENCADFRNTKVLDLYDEFKKCGMNISIIDPIVDKADVFEIHQININDKFSNSNKFDVIIYAVDHLIFKDYELDNLLKVNGFIFDVKGSLKRNDNVIRL